jgi:hypothetical protein
MAYETFKIYSEKFKQIILKIKRNFRIPPNPINHPLPELVLNWSCIIQNSPGKTRTLLLPKNNKQKKADS